MKLSLHIKERLYLINVLPQQNSLVDYQLKKGLIEKIGITEEEKKEFNFEVDEDQNNMTWNAQKDMENPREFEITDMERQYVRTAIEGLSDGSHPDEYWIIVTTIYEKLA